MGFKVFLKFQEVKSDIHLPIEDLAHLYRKWRIICGIVSCATEKSLRRFQRDRINAFIIFTVLLINCDYAIIFDVGEILWSP